MIKGYTVDGDTLKEFEVTLGELTDDEREIILKGCLINYNRVNKIQNIFRKADDAKIVGLFRQNVIKN